MTWRPIVTAPRDGTPVIGWVDSRKGPASGVMYVVWWTERFNAGWCFFDDGRGNIYSVYPSLWQPIPAPPAVERDLTKMEAGK
jgi:hypothetical protein